MHKGIENSHPDTGATTTAIGAAGILNDSMQPILDSNEGKMAAEKTKDTTMKNRN